MLERRIPMRRPLTELYVNGSFQGRQSLNIELGLLCTVDDDVGEFSEMYGRQCWQGCDADPGGFQKLVWHDLLPPGGAVTIGEVVEQLPQEKLTKFLCHSSAGKERWRSSLVDNYKKLRL